MPNDYYVYVYIDPRNFEEFYFGKGIGSRKDFHVSDDSDTEKVKRIREIQKAGKQPIIRVIAKDLTADQALLVEKILLWKLGKNLTNISSGYYAENFRPPNTMHLDLSGFDYRSSIYYYNIGEGPHRTWADYVIYGFISAGQGTRWRDAMLGFHENDIVAAYLKGAGFVGIGQLTSDAKPIRNVIVNGKPLLSLELQCPNMGDNAESDDLCEYAATVKWIRTVEPSQAKWRPKSGLYTTTHVRASLDGQPDTIKYLEKEFGVLLDSYLR